jgi:DNA-binding LacI/PurR family transcriptional regulator
MLTTVQLPVPAMAQAMVERAMGGGADPAAGGHEIVFTPTHLIERESVAAPPADAGAHDMPGATAKPRRKR